MNDSQVKFRDTVIKNFFDANDKLKAMPSQKKKKLVIFEYLISKLNPEQQYTEKEINAFIKQFHEDFCTIRREFIIHGFMARNESVYRVNAKEVWKKWESL
ncbi:MULTISPECIES: DUF2087 domain-containing protein [Bacillus cereus group]|uniref:DUF2087 domain-containing protein n=1 Tax=Bacillus cereus TaxID=1396 RepID=A0AA44TG71_BACCE|nr:MULTISPECIES: DUF2087 domain-containing protein [Bacillus cereus group]EEL51810.1 Transcriptional regulator [Bacillus cereus Rock3-44]PFN09150.1 DUF2087 domain-containing protein [Bacillus cereus]PFO80080.1 DUF2087 domain-containing protein [Bacillus cereus]PFR31089.1 DUF2087 domain-containing protein [Bacillus cereus]PFS06396.1 DUF2087 domain-containing protein [Bacillus cereus]